MKMQRARLMFLFCALCLTAKSQQFNSTLFNNIKPRNIGPAGMSGRVTAADVHPTNKNTIYIGTASGGLWQSENGGISWKPLFDSMEVASIGAVAIDRSNPNIIWAGTGEGNPRNSQTMGGGIFKSINGGTTWQYTGLKNTRTIHRLIVHPQNSNVVFATAQGNAWADTPDRGLYRTTDGGNNWQKILYVNERTGANDLVIDPSNPNRMLVSMWEYRRWPWFFKSGGPGSGLYLTEDGGETWKKLSSKNGLPEGELGKIGLSWATSNPGVVYALVESAKNALYRSNNGGQTWQLAADKNIGDRPFYYADIRVDPSNENRLYNVFSNVTVSEDGGRTFNTLLGWDNIHGDHHMFYIHPEDPSFMLDGNDGGIAISRDKGRTWAFAENLPVGQFYHVAVDNKVPYNVYGGMQDNGTWRGPAYQFMVGGIRNQYWQEIAFGDGFDVAIEPNQRYGYAMWQGGNLLRVDFETGGSQPVRPYHPDGHQLRFNWNAALAQDPLEPGTIYYGSQFVHTSSDGGKTWTIISPDLTTNDSAKINSKASGGLTFDVTGAENHCTIIALSASPRRRGIIWAGTDDGNIQVTQDGGKTWNNVSGNIPGVPAGSWVPQIHASRYNDGEAFVVINDYRRNNWSPYIFKTTDYGKTWKRLVDDKSVDGYALSFVQDPVEPRLMFAGTEFGLYVSLDGGGSWSRWTNGYPTVSTYDMVIHPREHDLVIGTFGRALWVLDDIRPLRQMAAQGLDKTINSGLEVYPMADAYLAAVKHGNGSHFSGNAMYQGENRPYGAGITFSLKSLKPSPKPSKAGTDTVRVLIKNEQGNVIRTLYHPARPGMNRVYWNLTHDGIRPFAATRLKDNAARPAGGYVMAGTYTAVINYNGITDSTRFNVLYDPRTTVDAEGIKAWRGAYVQLEDVVETASKSMDKLRDAKMRIAAFDKMVEVQVADTALKAQYQLAKTKTLRAIDSLMALTQPGEDIQGIYDDPSQLGNMFQMVQFYLDPSFGTPNPPTGSPSPSYLMALKQAREKANQFQNDVAKFESTQWNEFESLLRKLNVNLYGNLGER